MVQSTKGGAFLLLALVCGSFACGGGRKGTIDAADGIDVGGISVGGTLGSGGDRPITGTVATGGIGGGAVGGATMGTAATGGLATGGTATGGGAIGSTGGIGAGGLRTGGIVGSGGISVGGTTTVTSVIGGMGGGVRTGGTTSGTWASGGSGGWGTGGTTAGTGAGGASTGALLDLDGSRMDFGFVTPGTTTVGKFTLTNRGGAPSGLPVISISLDRNPGAAVTPLTVTGCNAALAPGASCVLTISVTPPVLGLFQAFVHVSANPGTETHGSTGLSIYVVGWATGFSVSSPTRIDLGDLAPGVTVKRSITVSATTALSDLKVWTAGSEVSIDASATTCTAALAQGASCVVAVTFVASTLGWKRDIIGVKAGGDLGQTLNIEMVANVTNASDLAIVPANPPHFVCVFEKTSPPVVLTVTNLGDDPSGTITATIVGADPSGVGARDFAVSQTDCTVLAPHATCTISVVCTPAMSASAATREVILSVSDGSTHLAVPLAGEVSFGP